MLMNAHVDREYLRLLDLALLPDDFDGEVEVECIFPHLVHNVPTKYTLRLTNTLNIALNFRRFGRLSRTLGLNAVRNLPKLLRNLPRYTSTFPIKGPIKIIARQG